MNDATIRITKVHINSSDDVKVHYKQFNETSRSWGKFTADEYEPPLDSFQESLDALAPLVRKYREDGVIDIDKYSVTGVSFVYGKTENPGDEATYKVVISAHRKLEQWGPANCNTPRLQVTAEDEEAVCVTEDEALKIEAVITEAMRYLNHERKQMPISFEDEAGGEEEEELPLGGYAEDADFEVVGEEGGDA